MFDADLSRAQNSEVHHVVRVVIHLAGAGVSGYALKWALARTYSLFEWPDGRYYAVVGGLVAATVLGLLAAWRALAARARGQAPDSAVATLGFGFTTFVLAAVCYLVFFQPFKGLYLLLYLGVVAGVHALLSLVGPKLLGAHRRRAAGAAALKVCLAVFLLEMTLKLLALIVPLPLFATRNIATEEVIRHFGMRPGQLHLGFACDARGFNDELRDRAPGAKLVVAIGDSFSIGVVPRPYHYTTVCEGNAPGLQVYNIGGPAFGPTEYLGLLHEVALPLAPDAVMICLFVGNDIDDARRGAGEYSLARPFFDRGSVLLYLIPARLLDLRAARPEGAGVQAWCGAGDPFGDAPDEAVMEARYPWLTTPLDEPPSMTDAKFMMIEGDRCATICEGAAADLFNPIFDALSEMQRVAGDTKLLVVLIPDELQVEDALWRRVRARPDSDRDRAQRVLKAWLDARGIPCLDLLPVLRGVPALADGDRHLYHLRDTHWNRRGNAFAGAALAAFLRENVR